MSDENYDARTGERPRRTSRYGNRFARTRLLTAGHLGAHRTPGIIAAKYRNRSTALRYKRSVLLGHAVAAGLSTTVHARATFLIAAHLFFCAAAIRFRALALI